MWRFSFFVYTCSFALALSGQVDLQAEFKAIVKGDDPAVSQRLLKALGSPAVQADPLLFARTLELKGEQFYRLGDIGEAKRLWDEALGLRIEHFGAHSAEAGAGHVYSARYHNHIAAIQSDHHRAAEEVAVRALQLLEQGGDVLPGELIMAERERAYAYKIFHYGKDNRLENASELARPYYRRALRTAMAHADTIWIAQVLHDLGNTFTDMAWAYRGDPLRTQAAIDSATSYYGRSMELLERIGLGLSEAMMMEHFTTALLHNYAHGPEGRWRSLPAGKRAIRILRGMAGAGLDGDILGYEPRVINKAQMVELLDLIAVVHASTHYNRGDPAHLDTAITVMEAAVPYWEAMLMDYRTAEIHKVVGNSGHYIFHLLAYLYAQRYLLLNEEHDLIKAFQALERNSNIKDQREQLLKDGRFTSSIAGPGQRLATTDGSLLIAYLSSFSNLAFLIGASGAGVIDLGPIAFDLRVGNNRFNEMPVNERSADPPAYLREAHALYQSLLGKVLEGRTERDLVIVPQGSLVHLPFEALVMDTTYSNWGDVAFVGKKYRIRYNSGLTDALSGPQTASFSQAAIGAAYAPGHSDLPFNRALADRFVKNLSNATFIDSLASYQMPDLLNAPGLLHIASHASSPRDPDAIPYLLLQDGEWDLNELQAAEVLRDLVVLGACSSGSGKVYLGENAVSMGHALLTAGAGTVVHTLWPVDDKATSEILGLMYDELLKGGLLSEALQKAKLEFIARHQHDGLADPFYWSGVVMTGKDVRFTPEERPYEWAWSAGGLLGIIAIAMFLYSLSRRSRARAPM